MLEENTGNYLSADFVERLSRNEDEWAEWKRELLDAYAFSAPIPR